MKILGSWNVLDTRYKPMAKVYDLILTQDRHGVHLVKRVLRAPGFGGRLTQYTQAPGESVYFSNKGNPRVSDEMAEQEVERAIERLRLEGCAVIDTVIFRAQDGAL